MALQTSGLISMAQINQELGRSSTGQISLNVYSSNGVAVVQVGTGTVNINQCSTLRPNTTAPTSITEWYGYDHSASCVPADPIFDLIRSNSNTLIFRIFNPVAGYKYSLSVREWNTNNVWLTLTDDFTWGINPSNPYLVNISFVGVLDFYLTDNLFANRVIEAYIRLYVNGVAGPFSNIKKEQ